MKRVILGICAIGILLFIFYPSAMNAQQCSPSPTSISSCGSTSSTRTFNIASGWSPSSCSGTTRGEGTWRYTAQYSGMHPIYVASISGSTTSSSTWCVYIKDGTTCSTSGWTYVGSRTSASTSSEAGSVFMEAGQSYLIGVDWRRSTAPTATASVAIRVGCYTPPNPCSGTPPTLTICSGSSTTRAFTGYSGNSSYDSYCSGYGDGEEYIYKFKTGAAGNYILNVTSVSGSGNRDVAYKFKKGTTCSSSSWTCAGARGSSGTLTLNNLSANSDYLLMLDAESDLGNSFSHSFRIDCPDPCGAVSTISSCGSTKSVSLSGPGSWSNSCPFSTPGAENVFKFTPTTTGTHYLRVTSASGGSLSYYVKNSSFCSSSFWTCLGDASTSGTVFPLNLTAYSTVHIMVDNPSNSTSSRNHTFTIDCPYDPCTNISTISCGSSNYLPLSSGPGAGWNVTSCSGLQTPGREKIYSFTPTVSGNYDLNITSALGTIRYFYKDASLGCDDQNWNCVGSTSSPTSIPMNLTGGTQYYILAEGASLTSSAYHYFTVECIDPCQSFTYIPSCGFSTSANMNASSGAGWNIPCGSHNGWGKERIFSFIPQQTDAYAINVTAASGAASYYIRPQSSGCGVTGWTCLDAMPSIGTTQTINLTAGTSYLILVDAEDSTQSTSQTFELTCAPHNPCAITTQNPQCGVVTTQVFPNGGGAYPAWAVTGCGSAGLGYQYLYDFTPLVSGDYDLVALNSTPLQVSYYYRPYSSTCDTVGFQCMGVLSGPGLAGTVSLVANNTYTFLIVNDSLSGGRVDFEIQGNNLTPPGSFAAANPGCDTVDLSWAAASNAIGYNLDVADDSLYTNLVGVYNDLPIGNITSYTVRNLNPGTPYYFRLRAQYSCGTSADTVASATTIGTAINLVASSNSPLCVGTSAQLDLTASSLTAGPYTWSGPNGFTSALQNETITPVTTSLAGIYTVSVTTVCGVITDTALVLVTPDPSQTTVSSNSPVCINSAINLSASGISGAIYSWTGPNGFTSNIQNPVINNAQTIDSGVYTLTLTVPGCNTAVITTSVSVQSSLSVTASSNSPVCAGGSTPLNLGVNTIPGAQYVWSGPNGFTSALQNPSIQTVTLSEAGNYSVTVTGSCGSGSDVVNVNVVQGVSNPSATVNSPVCSGASLNLSASTHAGASYLWAGPNGFTSALQYPVISNSQPLNSGQYSVTISAGGCTPVILTVNVNVRLKPVGTPTVNSPVCSGTAVYFNTPTVSGGSYYWIAPDGFTSNLQNPSRTPAIPAWSGVYTLIVSTQDCGSDTSSTSLSVGPQITSVQANLFGCTQVNSTVSMNASPVLSGASYSWTGPLGYTSNNAQNNILLTDISMSGQYSLLVTSPGCASINRTVNMTVTSAPALNPGSNSPVCAGSVLQLSALSISGASYSWQGPGGFVSTLISPARSNAQPAIAGVYTLSVNVPGCGSVTQTINVDVNGNPAQAVLSSNSPVCEGNNLNLSVTSVANATYTWAGPSGFTSSSQFPVISLVATSNSGAYTLAISSAGCTSVTRTINTSVQSVPQPNPGSNTPVCRGSIIYLSAASISGATYAWSGPNGFASTLISPAIGSAQTIHAGEYTLVVSSQSCGTSTTTTSVAVSQPLGNVSAAGNTPVCSGNALNLTGSTHAGATYAWTGPNGFTSSATTPQVSNITSLEAGNYIYNVSVPGCPSVSRTVTVVVNPAPTANPGSNSPLCAGSALYLTTNTVSGATYTWNGPSGFVSSTQNPSVSNVQPTLTGIYTLSVSINGCTPSVQTTQVTVNPGVSSLLASSNAPLCVGTDLNLSATVVSGATYAWTGPNGFTSSIAEPVILSAGTINAGTYNVVMTVPGCASVTRSLTVQVINGPSSNPGSNSPVCEGSLLYLTTSTVSGATYAWSGPNGFVSTSSMPGLNATTAMSGIYTLTITTQGCGAVTGTTVVQVGNMISNTVVTASTPVCSGSTLGLSSSRPGTILWTAPDGFTSNQQFVSRPNAVIGFGGVYTLAISSPGCGSLTRTINVVVSQAPVLTAGNSSPVCQGSPVYLNVNSVSGGTYQWSGPNGFASTAQNPAVSNTSFASAGIYTLNVNTNCGVLSTTTTVQVNSTVSGMTASSNMPVCVGGTLNLSSSLIVGGTYSWTGPGGFTANTQFPTRVITSMADAGTYVFTGTSPGCGTRTLNLTVRASDPALVNATNTSPVCVGSAVYFTGSAPSGSKYSWSGPAGFASSVQSPSRSNVQVLHAGVYTLTATLAGCGPVQATTNVVVNVCRTTNLSEDADAALMEVYPNPAQDVVYVKSSGDAIDRAELSDVSGRSIETLSFEAPVTETSFNISGLPSGTYLLRIESAGKVYLRKVVRQ